MLSVMYKLLMMSVIMLSVMYKLFMLSVIMLNVVAPNGQQPLNSGRTLASSSQGQGFESSTAETGRGNGKKYQYIENLKGKIPTRD